MKIKSLSKEELETMPFDDISYVILKEKGKKMKINEIFKIICDSLNLSDEEYENSIGDFFTLLTTEKRFIQLEKGYFDLRDNHSKKVKLEDDEDDDEIGNIEATLKEETDNTEEDYYDDNEDDDSEEELKDFIIIDSEEEE